MEIASKGGGSGLIGVIIFSASLPATRVAVSGLSPMFITSVRAVIAAVLAVVALILWRQVRPSKTDLPSLAIVAAGVVIGFPLMTALALQHITSARSIVFIGLLPLATAICGVIRGGERPNPTFWLFSCGGSLLVALYAWSQTADGTLTGDLLMLAAILTLLVPYLYSELRGKRHD